MWRAPRSLLLISCTIRLYYCVTHLTSGARYRASSVSFREQCKMCSRCIMYLPEIMSEKTKGTGVRRYFPIRAKTDQLCLSCIKDQAKLTRILMEELMVKEPEGHDHQHNKVNPQSDTQNGSQFQVLKVLRAVHQYRR